MLCEWCDKWGFTINFNKCKFLLFGNGNLYFPYKLGSVDLINSECEKILGVLDSSLSFCNHVYSCVKKASQVCNVILSNMFFVNNETLVKLYKFYARPYLDYANVFYSSHCLYLIDTVESVQRHFTKRLHNLCNPSYVNRLQVTALESLELRRLQTDLSFVYKILHDDIYSS